MEIILDKKEKADVEEMTEFIKNLPLSAQEKMSFIMEGLEKGIELGIEIGTERCKDKKSA